jgi:pyridoxine kinase
MALSVLALSSQVVFGPVGNSAGVPALQAAGCTVLQLPTILLSAHPGHGKPVVQRIGDETFQAMLENLHAADRLADLAGIMTGYFASTAQVLATAALIKTLQAANPNLFVLVDPVLGDEAGLYINEDIARALVDHLLPLATAITPNRFELAWLTGKTIGTPEDLADLHLPAAEILATSIPGSDHNLLTVLQVAGARHMVRTPKQPDVPNGTGDFLSGLYLAGRLRGLAPIKALDLAMVALHASIAASLGHAALALEPGLAILRQLSAPTERPHP